MARYIDAYKLLKKLCDDDPSRMEDFYYNAISNAPTADVVSMEAYQQVRWERDLAVEQLQSYGVGFAEDKELAEVRHGEWEFRYEGTYHRCRCYCSVCGKHSGIGGIKENQRKPYCPNCGAKMDGGGEK